MLEKNELCNGKTVVLKKTYAAQFHWLQSILIFIQEQHEKEDT